MAEPIRLSASGISSYDAKKAASAVEQAVNYLQQVKLDIDFKDSFSGMSMFPNTQGELRSVLSVLEKKKETIDALVTALSNGTQKIEDADAGFKNDLVTETLSEKIRNIVDRIFYSATIGNISLFGAYWLYSCFSSNEGFRGINEEWDESPDEFKDGIKNVLEKYKGDDGKKVYTAIDLTLDVLSGECDWDTLENFLKILGTDGTKSSAISKTIEMLVEPKGKLEELIDRQTQYELEGIAKANEGKYGESLLCYGKNLCYGLGVIGYGIGEVLTELASDAVEKFYDSMTLPVLFVRHFIPGKAGKVIYNLGDELDAGVDKITDWISDLL